MSMSNPYGKQGTGLARALGRLRDLHGDMTISQAIMFFTIATNENITQRTIWQNLGTNDAVASRTLAILSDVGNRTTPPLDLVKMTVNPMDRRERLLSLTPKGKRLMADILKDLS